MKQKEKLPTFKIITRMSVLDIPYESDEQSERDRENLWEEQNEILKGKGFEVVSTRYQMHFYDSPYTYDHTMEMDIDDAIQCLAIKDGVDLVQYDNGNYGFVAYYNGYENGFEILVESENGGENYV